MTRTKFPTLINRYEHSKKVFLQSDSVVLQKLWFTSCVYDELQVNKPAEVIRFSHPIESICKAALFITVSLYETPNCW